MIELGCEAARRVIWRAPDEHDTGKSLAGAFDHVAACEACSSFFVRDERLTRRLASLPATPAPMPLRETLSRTIRRERRTLLRRRLAWPLAVLATAATVTLILTREGPNPEAPIDFGALTAANIWDQSTVRTEATDPEVIMAWFAGHYDYEISVPDIPGGGVTGASVARFEGYPSAAVSYDMGGTKLTYLVVQASRVMDKSISNGDGPYYMSDRGDNTVLWGWGESARMLVGDLPAEDLLQIAERCRRHEMGQI